MSSSPVSTPRESFCQQLAAMQRGQFDDEITGAVRELVREMTFIADRGTSKPKAAITLKVEFVLDRGVMDVVADFAVKRPKKVRGRTLLYPSPSGELLHHDPQQLSLEVPGARDTAIDGTRTVRVVG